LLLQDLLFPTEMFVSFHGIDQIITAQMVFNVKGYFYTTICQYQYEVVCTIVQSHLHAGKIVTELSRKNVVFVSLIAGHALVNYGHSLNF